MVMLTNFFKPKLLSLYNRGNSESAIYCKKSLVVKAVKVKTDISKKSS